MKNPTSLRKNALVTFTLFGLAALDISSYTTDERKAVPPTRPQILSKVSFGSGVAEPLPVFADIAEKTSGAPFPNASRVTPANDSLILNRMVRYSSAGAR